jgi:hypothetical protein
MDDNNKHIVIVTRRFNEKQKGIGFNEESKGIKFLPHKVLRTHNFFHFWACKFAENDKITFTKKNIPDLDREALENLFKKLDEKCRHRIEKHEYLLNVYELSIRENHLGIFVYHHWLDKQGFPNAVVENDNNKHFLEYLREYIADILTKREKDINDFTVNWLIHDSDILPKTYDGCLYYNGAVFAPDYLGMSVEEFKKTINFPRTLEKDNIWCFVHEENISAYYSDYIINFNDKADLHDPKQFHDSLLYDKKACERRIEILGLTDDNRELTSHELLFILGRKPYGDFNQENLILKKFKELFNNDNGGDNDNGDNQ